jgi:hypothetical protein
MKKTVAPGDACFVLKDELDSALYSPPPGIIGRDLLVTSLLCTDQSKARCQSEGSEDARNSLKEKL